MDNLLTLPVLYPQWTWLQDVHLLMLSVIPIPVSMEEGASEAGVRTPAIVVHRLQAPHVMKVCTKQQFH